MKPMYTHNVVNFNNLKHISYCVVPLSLFGITLRIWAQISGVQIKWPSVQNTTPQKGFDIGHQTEKCL